MGFSTNGSRRIRDISRSLNSTFHKQTGNYVGGSQFLSVRHLHVKRVLRSALDCLDPQDRCYGKEVVFRDWLALAPLLVPTLMTTREPAAAVVMAARNKGERISADM